MAPAFARYIGIDHGFSFPLRYFELHQIPPDWPVFLEDFQRHWPTDRDHIYVDFVRHSAAGNGAADVDPQFGQRGLAPMPLSSDAFTAFMQEDAARWEQTLRSLNITLE